MVQSLTDWLQQSRLTVVAIDKENGRLRVKQQEGQCSDLTCHGEAVVVADDGTRGDLDLLNPGDIIRVEPAIDRPERVIVVRRAWDELTSPEF
ncbi:MAG TPA: hypothetical protein VJO34_07180 [Methylomirabilota bacterium]|nr:hypothetical protein [Methylomirabilota bacterium]